MIFYLIKHKSQLKFFFSFKLHHAIENFFKNNIFLPALSVLLKLLLTTVGLSLLCRFYLIASMNHSELLRHNGKTWI